MPEEFFNNNSLSLDTKQTQTQHLTMKQRQALEVLFLSLPELETKLNEALLTNPLLEVEEIPEEHFPETELPRETAPETEDESRYEAEFSEGSDEWSEELPLPPGESSFSEGNCEDFLLYTPAAAPPLRDMLLTDLNLHPALSRAERRAAEAILLNLEDDGMLRTPLEDIAMSSDLSMTDLRTALKVVQSLEPAGVGARSFQECLLLQLEREGKKTALFEKLLTENISELEHNRPDIAARNLGIAMDELKTMFETLRHLKYPPVTAASAAAAVITPEVEIVPDGQGNFAANPLRERRRVKLSEYATLASAADAGADFAAKVKEGKNLLEALEFRKGTVLRMAEMLIEIQREFLESGPEKLRPFTMKQAAEYLDFKSESTISRAAASKYVKTPHGVFPFKYFFTSGYVKEDGNEVSRTADMELLKKLVDEEDKKHPLSDDKLSQLLNQAGHPVARRTVAKYRDLLHIPSSTLRKEHF